MHLQLCQGSSTAKGGEKVKIAEEYHFLTLGNIENGSL